MTTKHTQQKQTQELFGFRLGSEWSAAKLDKETDKAISVRFVCEENESKPFWFPRAAISEAIEGGVKTLVVAPWFAKKCWNKVIFDMQAVGRV